MDAVSVSEVAMDAVSVSDIALDAIWASTVGWDAVKTKSMAVGKFAVGRAGLDGADYADVDAVATSQAAMDAVSTSNTARGAVHTSLIARSAYLLSQYVSDTLWATEAAATDFWTSKWSPALPYDNGYMKGGVVTDSNVADKLGTSADTVPRPDTIEGEAAYYQEAVGDAGTEDGLSLTFDLTDAQNLHITTYFYWLDYADTDSTLFVKVGGDKVFELSSGTGTQHTWTDRTFDVSTYDGETEVEFGITSYNTQFHVGLFSNLRFS